jgi:hypothetical protein
MFLVEALCITLTAIMVKRGSKIFCVPQKRLKTGQCDGAALEVPRIRKMAILAAVDRDSRGILGLRASAKPGYSEGDRENSVQGVGKGEAGRKRPINSRSR